MWTVIYSNIRDGWRVMKMTSSHDGDKATEDARQKLAGMWGPDEVCRIVAMVKGSSDVYQPDVGDYL
tara:strand:- start:265 stop:465 length:201 start_codon:yes stop_codon:yes gene_type:complete